MVAFSSFPLAFAVGWAGEREREQSGAQGSVPQGTLRIEELGLATCLYCFLRVHTGVGCARWAGPDMPGGGRFGWVGCASVGLAQSRFLFVRGEGACVEWSVDLVQWHEL